jgi:hypothetical protein
MDVPDNTTRGAIVRALDQKGYEPNSEECHTVSDNLFGAFYESTPIDRFGLAFCALRVVTGPPRGRAKGGLVVRLLRSVSKHCGKHHTVLLLGHSWTTDSIMVQGPSSSESRSGGI